MTGRDAPNGVLSVVLLVRSLNYGGAERQLVELAKGLLQRGHNVVVAVFYAEGRFFGELHEAGVDVVVLHKRGRWDVVPFLFRLTALLRRRRPQIVYAFMVEPSLIATLLKPIVRPARVVWGVRMSSLDLDRYGWFLRLTLRLSRALARFASLIIANSWAGAAHFQGLGYPARKMAVVPNGIDAERFRPDPAAGRRQRASWGIPDDAPVVGLVGRLDAMKDHGTFLKAARLVERHRPQSWFVCVGDGPAPYRAHLQGLAADLGIAHRVLWVGWQDDMVGTYNALDVCCLCSAFGEGFSIALAEAMACGVRCVATDVGDAARILEGCAGVLPPRNAELLAAAIGRALDVARSEPRGGCRERVERHFSVERMVTETERLLYRCVHDT